MLAQVAHLGYLVGDLESAMARLAALGVQWGPVATPVAVLRRPDGAIERRTVRYVAQAGGEPRVKLIEGGGFFTAVPDVHHLSYWVDDLAAATSRLTAAGWTVEATGLEPGTLAPRYVYLAAPPLGWDGPARVELGLSANRAEFDAWADARADA